MANRIMLNQTSYHGAGAIEEIVNEAKAHAFQKAFVCSDPDLIKFGVTGKVTDLLDKEGLAYEIYSDIKANPTIDNVKNGVAAFKASGAYHRHRWWFFHGYLQSYRYHHCQP